MMTKVLQKHGLLTTFRRTMAVINTISLYEKPRVYYAVGHKTLSPVMLTFGMYAKHRCIP